MDYSGDLNGQLGMLTLFQDFFPVFIAYLGRLFITKIPLYTYFFSSAVRLLGTVEY